MRASMRTSGSLCVRIRRAPWLCSISSFWPALTATVFENVRSYSGRSPDSAAEGGRGQRERREKRRGGTKTGSDHDLTSFIRFCSVRCFSWYMAISSLRRCVL